MGVLACNRRGCENIMCDHYSHEFGYICYECLSELKELPFKDIEDFMDSYKGCREDSPNQDQWEELLYKTFKNRFEEEED